MAEDSSPLERGQLAGEINGAAKKLADMIPVLAKRGISTAGMDPNKMASGQENPDDLKQALAALQRDISAGEGAELIQDVGNGVATVVALAAPASASAGDLFTGGITSGLATLLGLPPRNRDDGPGGLLG